MNSQHINLVKDAVERMHQDVNMLYDITSSLYTSMNYQQIVLYICSIMTQVTMHAMDCIDTATTGILSPHVLPVADLQKMLLHIEEALPSTMHLPVSSEDTLHFYRYLYTHILITDKQFPLLIDVPIQDHAQQLKIYEIFDLVITHGNLSASYNIESKYLDITYDETKTVEILEQLFGTCQQANGQVCSINAPLQPLSNPPSFISAIYAKNKAGIEKDVCYRSEIPTVSPS